MLKIGDFGLSRATCDGTYVSRQNIFPARWTAPEGMEHYMQHLRKLVTRHVEYTNSDWGRQVLRDFRGLQYKFWLVKPKAASLAVLAEELRSAA